MNDKHKMQLGLTQAFIDLSRVEVERDELRTALRGLMQWVEDNTREAERLMGHWPPNWQDLQALVEGDTDD